MYFVEVLVASAAFHGEDALTYSCDRQIVAGTVVCVPLRNKQALGIVVKEVKKPPFVVKPVLEIPDLPPLDTKALRLIAWIQTYYPGPLGALMQQFLPKSLPKKPVDVPTLDVVNASYSTLPALTPEQQTAINAIDGPGTYLLHGETGTGKTRVYIELAKKSIDNGHSAIILTPEISLTSQLENNFRAIFGNRVVIIHSQLTEVTRQRLWVQLLRQEEPVIVIGARSALFVPIHSLGLIVVDEAHETAYKQDQTPYYHASRIASTLATLYGAPLILGSATPLITDYFLANIKQRPILRMQQTAVANNFDKSEISIVDLRDRSKFTKKSYLSDMLINAIGETLKKGEQTVLFLNRRGTARVVFCEQCGWQAICPHCDLPLVYHGDLHQMRCHSCNYSAPSPASCPNCHNASVLFKSIGTKAIVDEVQKIFPDARIKRFDNDNKKHERIEQNYVEIRNGSVDILIGTQTLAKGLDLPHLSLVGVVIADTSLYFPDFSAGERTYQLLSQVLGRIGRGHRAGRAIVQTYTPDSPLLKSVLSHDWDTFYESEIAERETFLFPPFCYLLKLHCRRASEASAQKAATNFVQTLKLAKLRVTIEGPAPAFHERVQNKFQWQLVIKAKERHELLKIIRMLPSGWSYDIDPMNLL